MNTVLVYLLKRLLEAQGFDSYADNGFTRDPERVLRHARKEAKGAKGARYDILLHRYYGKHPQEGSSSVFIVLPIQVRENGIELVPNRAIIVKQPDYSQYPNRGWDERAVQVTGHKATWMTILNEINNIRRPRQRKPAVRVG